MAKKELIYLFDSKFYSSFEWGDEHMHFPKIINSKWAKTDSDVIWTLTSDPSFQSNNYNIINTSIIVKWN